MFRKIADKSNAVGNRVAGRRRLGYAVFVLCLLLKPAFPEGAEPGQYPPIRFLEELAVYANARTLLEASPEELIKRYPELKKTLVFSKDQEQLEPLLRHAGDRVSDFFRAFRNTSSTEDVVQRLENSRGISRTSRSKFMYLMLSGSSDESQESQIEEYRADEKGKPLDLQGLESGFLLASKLLGQLTFLLPGMQEESRFRYLGMTSNPSAHLVAFAQKPERPSTVGTLLTLNGPKLLLYQGLVWLNPQTHQVLRMRSDLLVPRGDILLDRQTTDIEFQEVRFPDERSLWLPREVNVDAVYMNIRYRNRHRYSDYQRFTVESKDEIKRPQVPPLGVKY